MALVEIDELTIRFGDVTVVDRVSLRLEPGDRLGVIGASGSGKSLTALAAIGLLPDDARVTGSVRLNGEELLGRRDRELARLRGAKIGMVFQEPLTALNPTMRVGRQIAEPLRLHAGLSRKAAAGAALELADRVGLPDPEHAVRAFPHQLSGGQRQRVGIAAAIACRPAVLIADEPTTALDVTVQARILALIDELVDEAGTALAFITHDLAVAARVCRTVAVMDAGRVVERGPLLEVLHTPSTFATRVLLDATAATALREEPAVAEVAQ